MDTGWWSGDMFSAMRTRWARTAPASTWKPTAAGNRDQLSPARQDVVDFATRGGAKALGLDSVGAAWSPAEGRPR